MRRLVFRGAPMPPSIAAMLLGSGTMLLAGLPRPAWPADVPQGSPQVDLMLVLAADVSRSIDADKYELQRKGYASAMSDPEVLRAIAAGPTGRIAVAFVEWAGASSQKLVIGWTVVGTAAEAQAFGAKVAVAPRSFMDRTAIGSAIDFSAGLFEAAPVAASRKIIDISGDGDSNGGRDIRTARDDALAHGITTINGIVIMSDMNGPAYLVAHTHPPGGLQAYYRQNVTGGVNSFVAVADGFESFGRSLVAKLIQEIS